MKQSPTQRRLAHDSYVAEKIWAEQVHLSSGSKPTNAQHEAWTTDMVSSAAEAAEVKQRQKVKTSSSGPPEEREGLLPN